MGGDAAFGGDDIDRVFADWALIQAGAVIESATLIGERER